MRLYLLVLGAALALLAVAPAASAKRSYSRCGDGWRGDIGTGGWGMRQSGSGARIGGGERYR